MARASFVFYKSFYDAISIIKDKELRCDIYEAICELGLNENVIELNNDVGMIIMELIRPQMQANSNRYYKGKNGGRPQEYDHDYIVDMIKNGISAQEIIEITGCSKSLVKKISNEIKSVQKLNNNSDNNLDNNLDKKWIKSQKLDNNQDNNLDNNQDTNGTKRQKPNVNENDNVNVNVNDNVNDNNLFISSSSYGNKRAREEKNIYEFFEQEFCYVSGTVVDKLEPYRKEFDDELIKQAIRECVCANVKTINYLEGVLRNWKGQGIRTIADWQAKKQNKNKKNEVQKSEKYFDYDWLNEEEK